MAAATLAHRAEYYALRGAVAALDGFGIRRAARIGEWLGALGYRPFGIRRAVVERQVRAAFPEFDEAEVDRVAKASYESLGRTAIETALLPARSREQVIGMFSRVEGWDIVERAMAQGKGILFVTGHLGNWE